MAKTGEVVPNYEADPVTHKNIEKLIESSLLKTPAETVFTFAKGGSGVHMNMITLPGSPDPRIFLISSNADGKVDVLEKGKSVPCRQLPILSMQCSF